MLLFINFNFWINFFSFWGNSTYIFSQWITHHKVNGGLTECIFKAIYIIPVSRIIPIFHHASYSSFTSTCIITLQ
ncbi:hypothetical protein X975_21461, partial [Stegodyphus mimosarum]